MTRVDALETTYESADTRLDVAAKGLVQIHVEWQRDRAKHIRLEARIESLLSMVSEIAIHLGLSPEHVATCFRERFLYFQDQDLQEVETASPDLAAHIDTRVSAEIPTEQDFRPLFSDS